MKRFRDLLVLALVVWATLVASAPALADSSFRLRIDDSRDGTFYLAGKPDIPWSNGTTIRGVVLVRSPVAPGVVWRLVPAGTVDYRGPTLIRIVNQRSGECMQVRTSGLRHYGVRLAPCSITGTTFTVWSGGMPLRGAGNLPAGGPGYSFRRAAVGVPSPGFSWCLSVTGTTFREGTVLDVLGCGVRLFTTRVLQQFILRPVGG